MNFEFYSAEGHDAYKKRRKDWSGPYEEYKRVDPYEHFIEESVKIEYWEPAEEDLWLDFEWDFRFYAVFISEFMLCSTMPVICIFLIDRLKQRDSIIPGYWNGFLL